MVGLSKLAAQLSYISCNSVLHIQQMRYLNFCGIQRDNQFGTWKSYLRANKYVTSSWLENSTGFISPPSLAMRMSFLTISRII